MAKSHFNSTQLNDHP